MKRLSRCTKCGGITTQEDKSTHSIVTCMECGDTDFIYQDGRDDGPDPTDKVKEFGEEFEEEDDEDEVYAPGQWWDDEDEADE